LRSISEHIGNDYRRVRIGVGHPGDKDLVQHYVLSDFAKSDRGWVDALVAIIGDNAELIARGQDASFQNKVHLAMVAKGFGQPERDEENENDDSK
jgi:PTH1 family peptidyl-tRNA hydrolase